MENFVGWALIMALPALLGVGCIWMFKRHDRKHREEIAKREEAREILRKERDASWKRVRNANNYPIQQQSVGNNSVGIQSRGNITYTASPNTDINDFATMIVLNEALKSNSGSVRGSVDHDTRTVEVEETKSSYSSSWSSSSSDVGSSSSWDSSSSSDSGSSWD